MCFIGFSLIINHFGVDLYIILELSLIKICLEFEQRFRQIVNSID